MPKSTRTPVVLACLAILQTATQPGIAVAESSAGQRPNIVLIVAGNQPARLLGTYGNREIATPSIDGLARALYRAAALGVPGPLIGSWFYRRSAQRIICTLNPTNERTRL